MSASNQLSFLHALESDEYLRSPSFWEGIAAHFRSRFGNMVRQQNVTKFWSENSLTATVQASTNSASKRAFEARVAEVKSPKRCVSCIRPTASDNILFHDEQTSMGISPRKQCGETKSVYTALNHLASAVVYLLFVLAPS
jgi:hypothetical protein